MCHKICLQLKLFDAKVWEGILLGNKHMADACPFGAWRFTQHTCWQYVCTCVPAFVCVCVHTKLATIWCAYLIVWCQNFSNTQKHGFWHLKKKKNNHKNTSHWINCYKTKQDNTENTFNSSKPAKSWYTYQYFGTTLVDCIVCRNSTTARNGLAGWAAWLSTLASFRKRDRNFVWGKFQRGQ